MKVFELAKELDIQSKELTKLMKDMGIEVGGHMSVLDESKIDDIIDFVEQNRINKENQELKNKIAELEKASQSPKSSIEIEEDIIPEIPMNKTVKIMSLFNGGLNLKTSNDGSATVFRFNFVGETYPIIYSDLVKIIANQRILFKEGYCMILDKDVVKAHYLEDDYKRFVDGKVINEILNYDVSKIKEIFSNATKVNQQAIVDVIINKINSNEYYDKNKISVISGLYGHDIFEIANKMK